MENSLFRGFELSWNPVDGKDVVYQVSIKKIAPSDEKPYIVYKGNKTECFVNKLDVKAKYSFMVRYKKGSEPWGQSKRVFKKVEPLNVKMAMNTLNKCTSDAEVCADVLKELKTLIIDGKNNILLNCFKFSYFR